MVSRSTRTTEFSSGCTVSGAWSYRVSSGTGEAWCHDVNVLRLDEIASLMYSFYLIVVARTAVCLEHERHWYRTIDTHHKPVFQWVHCPAPGVTGLVLLRNEKPGVNVLRLAEIASLMDSFYLTVAARTAVCDRLASQTGFLGAALSGAWSYGEGGGGGGGRGEGVFYWGLGSLVSRLKYAETRWDSKFGVQCLSHRNSTCGCPRRSAPKVHFVCCWEVGPPRYNNIFLWISLSLYATWDNRTSWHSHAKHQQLTLSLSPLSPSYN